MQTLSAGIDITEIPNWIQAACSVIMVVLGIIGIAISLPKITKKIDKITTRFSRRKFPACENCPYDPVCSSPYIEDTGDFDKIREIENSAISKGIVELYNEIKEYEFDSQKLSVGSKNHQGCLLHKLTLAINLIGGANMGFNMVKLDKDHFKKGKEHGE